MNSIDHDNNSTRHTTPPPASTPPHDAVKNASSYARGVAEVIHGIGENIRGTALAALDRVSNDDTSKNEEIAEQGRLETQRGLALLKGEQLPPQEAQFSTYSATQPTYGTPAGSAFTAGSETAGSNIGAFEQKSQASEYSAHAHDAGFLANSEPSAYGQATPSGKSTATQYAPGASAAPTGPSGLEHAAEGTQARPRRFGTSDKQGTGEDLH